MTSRNFRKAKEIMSNGFYVRRNIVASDVLSVDYIRYKMLLPFYRLNYFLFINFHPTWPRISQGAVKILNKVMGKNMRVLEYGSGRSTIYLARRCKSLTTIEHDESWFKTIKLSLRNLNIKNVEYLLIRKNNLFRGDLNPNTLPTKFNKYPVDLKHFETRPEFRDYFEHVLTFPDNHFDVIFLDGRARVECLVNSIDKLKPDGILVLDNSNRERYQPAFDLLHDWPKITTSTGYFDTTLWFKPSDDGREKSSISFQKSSL